MLSLWEPISASLAPSTEVHNHAKMNIFGYKISSRKGKASVHRPSRVCRIARIGNKME